MMITEIEQLKAVSDPLRLRLIEVMGEHLERGWTAKELAERLGTKQTKLYHHINLLEERGFVRVAGTRMVSGILEKRYQLTASTFRVDHALLGGGERGEAVAGAIDAMFAAARGELLGGIEAGLIDMSNDAGPDARRMALSLSHTRLSAASARKVMRLVERLVAMGDLDDPEGTEYGFLIGFYPKAAPKDTDR
jgi:DNA-binding transcriptional ArsR family regulator